MNKRWLLLFIVVGLVFMLAVSGCTDFQAAEYAYNRVDYETALKKFLPLANQGDAAAQHYLGVMYGEGKGVPQDYQEAMKWYRLAAEQGDADAQYNLGGMYQLGLGVPQNYQEAARWYQKAAEQGDSQAQFNLGTMYDEGQGVPKDYVLAYMWMNLAVAKGVKGAVKARDRLEKLMTPAQLAEAQRLARGWTPKGK